MDWYIGFKCLGCGNIYKYNFLARVGITEQVQYPNVGNNTVLPQLHENKKTIQ